MFLAAIMVISMLAMPVAFAGAAAADVEDGDESLDFNDQALNGTDVLVEDVTAQSGQYFVVNDSDGDNVATQEITDELDGDNEEIDVSSASPGEHTVYIANESGDDADFDDPVTDEVTALVVGADIDIADLEEDEPVDSLTFDNDSADTTIAFDDGDDREFFVAVTQDDEIIGVSSLQDGAVGEVEVPLSETFSHDGEGDDTDYELGAQIHYADGDDPGVVVQTTNQDEDPEFVNVDDEFTLTVDEDEDADLAAAYGVDRFFTNTTDLEGAAVWQGQEIAVGGFDANDDEVQLRERVDSDTDRLRDELTSDGSGVVTFETEARDDGDYFLRGDNVGITMDRDDYFEINEQDLTAEFDDNEVANSGANAETEIEFDSNRGSYNINVSADGDLDVEELTDIFGEELNVIDDNEDDDDDTITLARPDSTSGVQDGDYDVNFTDIDEGDYDFDFEVTDSTASASDSVTVEDRGDGELSVEDAEERQGDIAEIVVSADNTDEGSIVIGDEDDVNYQINATIDFGDADEVTISFNSYLAGQTEDGQFDVEGSDVLFIEDADDDEELDDIEEAGSATSLLDTGDYEVTVSGDTDPAETLDNPDDVGSLFIEERAIDDINTWTAASDVVDDLLDEDDEDQADFALDGIENDLITESDAIAHDDYVVHQIEASGLEGILETIKQEEELDSLGEAFQALATDDDFSDRDSESAVDLRIRETRDSVGPNADRQRVDIENTDMELVHDDEGEQYFLLINTEDMELAGENLEQDEDYEFDVRFRLQDERLLDVDDDDLEDEDDQLSEFFESVTTDHEVLERDGEFDLSDDDLVEVEAGEDQEITGEVNIAPGSEVNIRIRGSGDARFSKSQSDIVVDADQTFTGEFDFSDRDVDDEFEATLRDVVTEDDDPEEDGLVVDAVEEVDDDEADDEDDVVDDEDDVVDDEDDVVDDEEDDLDDDVEDVDDETPGFGAIVALVALIGAALLAVRRQN